ncbi:hypothetical protein M9H77_06547 [Catharanthus roseus]|uniref:Uncharacterized protein n=1 Tax=Catharanthus roseus TaxID=4058 RepID=A0ACC0BSN1_CATRO|nr:hypothetical protein M9H77_06547 [Catharanthus roseus]
MHTFLHMVCNVKYKVWILTSSLLPSFKTATRRMENSLTSDLSTFENVFCLNYYEYQKYIDLKKKKEEEHSRIGTCVPTNTELMLKVMLSNMNYKNSPSINRHNRFLPPNAPTTTLFNFVFYYPT